MATTRGESSMEADVWPTFILFLTALGDWEAIDPGEGMPHRVKEAREAICGVLGIVWWIRGRPVGRAWEGF